MSSALERIRARKRKVQELIEAVTGHSDKAEPSSGDVPFKEPVDRANDGDKPHESQEASTSAECEPPSTKMAPISTSKSGKPNIDQLLSAPTAKELQSRQTANQIAALINCPTVKELAVQRQFRSDGCGVREFCQFATRQHCAKRGTGAPCDRLHFRRIVQQHTDLSLGDCSFLNTCFHMNTCKFIHYEVDYSRGKQADEKGKVTRTKSKTKSTDVVAKVSAVPDPAIVSKCSGIKMCPPQWIACDLRTFPLSILSQCAAVVMADPPWDIHMQLPYGTMGDDEMRGLDVACLQSQGLFFLWVTGRAMELGRSCLRQWGYSIVDELVWVKTNQLQRIIRTGRTGHWLNHAKEHCLIGVKHGTDLSRFAKVDCDVIVAEVRETSHKPDEIYGLIERLAPGERKVELFGRQHNLQPNWITLGNQLDGVRLHDPEIAARFHERFPDGRCMPAAPSASVRPKTKAPGNKPLKRRL